MRRLARAGKQTLHEQAGWGRQAGARKTGPHGSQRLDWSSQSCYTPGSETGPCTQGLECSRRWGVPQGAHLVPAAARNEDGLVLVLLHVPHVHTVPLPEQLPVLVGEHKALQQGVGLHGVLVWLVGWVGAGGGGGVVGVTQGKPRKPLQSRS